MDLSAATFVEADGSGQKSSEPDNETGYQSASANDTRSEKSQPRLQLISRIVGPSRVFLLRQPLLASVSTDAGGLRHVTVGRGLPVEGFGNTLKLALDDFYEMFEVQYEGLVERPLEELADSAKRARRALQDVVADARTIAG